MTLDGATVAPSNVTHLGRLEMGCRATFVKEVNGRSTGETCLIHPRAIEVPDEIGVSVTHNPTVEEFRCPVC